MVHTKHSSAYYIFWIFVPIVLGIFLAGGVVWGLKVAYANLYGEQESSIVKEEGIERKNQEEIKKAPPESPVLKSQSAITARVTESLGDRSVVESIKKSLPRKPSLSVTAVAFIAGDLDTGEILVEKNKDKVLPIASLTKLITALVSLKTQDQNALVTISRNAVNTYGTAGSLSAGEKMRVSDLLYPMLLESSNDAAEALAQSKNRANFIKAMNQSVLELGATHTSFSDASGLSSKNVSSPRDLFKIAEHIYKNRNNIFEITKRKSYKLGKHVWQNSTFFLRLDEYLGGKNGYTEEAGRTAVSLFKIPEQDRPDRNIAVVVLKSADRNADVASIVNYIAEMDFQELSAPNSDEDSGMEFY